MQTFKGGASIQSLTAERIVVGEAKLLHPATDAREVLQIAADALAELLDLLRREAAGIHKAKLPPTAAAWKDGAGEIGSVSNKQTGSGRAHKKVGG